MLQGRLSHQAFFHLFTPIPHMLSCSLRQRPATEDSSPWMTLLSRQASVKVLLLSSIFVCLQHRYFFLLSAILYPPSPPFIANDTILEFVGCSFENGTCGWEDNSLGQSQWARGRNASENLGPATDHTVGTEFGEDAP